MLAVAGLITPDEVHRVAHDAFVGWANGVSAPGFQAAPTLEEQPRLATQLRSSEQAHVQIAVPGLSRTHPDRFVLTVLNTLLGDGMTSRLWQRLREQLGLAYNIGSYLSLLADSGVVGVYGGCDASRLFETLNEIMDVWQALQAAQAPDSGVGTL